MLAYLVLLTVLAGLSSRQTAAQACPRGCSCYQKTIRCERMRFTQMPAVANDTTTLDLRHNHIKTIPGGYFEGFGRLHTLLLTNNHISKLDPDVFRGLKSLRYLYLYKNEITGLYANMFQDLGNLVHLYLHFNNISSLPAGVFNGLSSLEKLNLHHNAISSIDSSVFEPLPTLHQLRLDSNQLVCDCQLSWIQQVAYNARTAHVNCYEPRKLRGKSVLALSPEDFRCGKPMIVRAPDNERVTMGQPVLLHCQAVGFPKPHVTWMHNDSPLTPTGRKQILNDGSLMISETHPGDDGVYQCHANNVKGKASATAQLSYTFSGQERPPVLTVSPPATLTTSINSTIVLKCSAEGFPIAEVSWYKEENGQIILPRGSISIPAGTTNLRIAFIKLSDEGVYTCRAVNRAGSSVARSQVTVNVPPNILDTPARLTLVEGDTARFRCHAKGKPKPEVIWMKKRQKLPSSSKQAVDEEGQLFIRRLAVEDSGEYRCEAKNSAGTAVKKFQLFVRIRQPPKFVHQPSDVAVVEGQAAFFQCQAADQVPVIWLKEGLRIEANKRISLSRSGTLRIDPVKLSDAGSFLCVARNRDGVSSAGAQLSVQVASQPKRTSQASSTKCIQSVHQSETCSNMCYHKRYRTVDGTCNNLEHPDWGSSVSPLQRLLSPVYTNGNDVPSANPSARLVSTEIVTAHRIRPDPRYTHMLMQFGQFLDHDISHSPMIGPSSDCAHCRQTAECLPIPIPPGDHRIRTSDCMPFARSTPACGTGRSTSPRQQINQLTSYIDGSVVYGSTAEKLEAIRDRRKGLLTVGKEVAPGKHLLPFYRQGDLDTECLRPLRGPSADCFLTGDRRGNEQVGLTALHTIWLREHNRIAGMLATMNPHWDDERIFQETRKVIAAELQHITYAEFLPKILGDKAMAKYVGPYAGYNPDVDVSIANGFSTSAYRFGHSLIRPVIRRLNASFQSIPEGDLALHKAFFAPHRIINEGGIDPIIRGLFASSGKLNGPSEVLNSELTEGLFALTRNIALDLGALNVQRGRDHGLPKYLAWRSYCNLSTPNDYDELKEVTSDSTVREKLRRLYGKPEDIDMWVGGLVEDLVPGARVGPLFACVIGEQFRRLRDGDRFWYENAGVFDPAQLTQLKRTTFARVLCENGDAIARVQRDVFLNVDNPDQFQSCSVHPKLDLRFWAHCGGAHCTSENECKKTQKEVHKGRLKRSVDMESFVENSLKPVQFLQTQATYLNNKTAVMEDTIEELTEYVRALTRTVSDLESKLTGVRDNNCLVGGGKVENGERIALNACVNCICESGQLICERLICPETACPNPVKIQGECCSRC